MELIVSDERKNTSSVVTGESVLLNLGCGGIRPSAWVNVDGSLNALLQNNALLKIFLTQILKRTSYDSNNIKYANLNKPWAFPSESVDVVYSSHVLEHLSISSAKLFLDEAFRVLKPEGIIRIVVPDLYEITKKYISQYEAGEIDADSEFLSKLNLHQENFYSPSELVLKKLLDILQSHPHQHKYMYSERGLSEELKRRRFKNLQTSSYGQSALLENIRDVEFMKEYEASIYIEAEKP